jgi:hypothetical protein
MSKLARFVVDLLAELFLSKTILLLLLLFAACISDGEPADVRVAFIDLGSVVIIVVCVFVWRIFAQLLIVYCLIWGNL